MPGGNPTNRQINQEENKTSESLMLSSSQSIPRFFVRYAMKEAKKPHNSPKNRYVDILPCESELFTHECDCCTLGEVGG